MTSSTLPVLVTLTLTISLFTACKSSESETTEGEISAGGEMGGDTSAGEMTSGEEMGGEVVAGEMTGGEVVAGEMPGGEVTPSLRLGSFSQWRRPIDDYIETAVEVIGPELDRGIHELTVWRNRLYMGYGDADLNAGGVSPIKIYYFDSPEGERRAEPLETGEEGIYRYRHIQGELMLAGVDSTDADELTSRPLIEGNFLRTREGTWEKYRAIQGGEHVHDVAQFYEGLWAVGSGADNRDEWENRGVYRYLWFSGDGGTTWRRYKRVFREEAGDTRFVHLLSVGIRLYVFGYLNPRSGNISPRNEMILGPTGEPTPLPNGDVEGEEAHPLSRVFVVETYSLNAEEGVISGFDINVRRWRAWWVNGAGEIQALDTWSEALWGTRRVVDLSVDQDTGALTVLVHDDNELNGTSGRVFHGPSIQDLHDIGEVSFIEGEEPRSITLWNDSLYLGRADGSIWSAPLTPVSER